jgi:hypothetical protein
MSKWRRIREHTRAGEEAVGAIKHHEYHCCRPGTYKGLKKYVSLCGGMSMEGLAWGGGEAYLGLLALPFLLAQIALSTDPCMVWGLGPWWNPPWEEEVERGVSRQPGAAWHCISEGCFLHLSRWAALSQGPSPHSAQTHTWGSCWVTSPWLQKRHEPTVTSGVSQQVPVTLGKTHHARPHLSHSPNQRIGHSSCFSGNAWGGCVCACVCIPVKLWDSVFVRIPEDPCVQPGTLTPERRNKNTCHQVGCPPLRPLWKRGPGPGCATYAVPYSKMLPCCCLESLNHFWAMKVQVLIFNWASRFM